MVIGNISRNLSMSNLVDTHNATIRPALFSHPDIYEQELEQIFARMWLFVGHVSQIPNPGDFVRSRMGEEQVIVTRGRDNQIHVMLNSCPHRGNMVCRYDRGHGLAFQCSFHGWTFDSAGRLINLPPAMEEEYAADLRKEEWGMLKSRVEVFHGAIWANWDETAPSFREYLGGAAAYLEAALSDAEGDPDGTELAGGIMKWRVGMNWKVPMPDNDITHGWITHRSMRGAGMGQGGDGGELSSSRDRFDGRYHVWFPEGHTTSVFELGERSEGGDGSLRRNDVIREYMRERAAKRSERLGKMASTHEFPHVFPNIGAVGRIIRVMHPQGPAASEMWSYILVDKAAPPEVKRAIILGRQRISGPNGIQQKDDMENWFIQTRYSKGYSTRWRLRQNNQLGMSRPSLDGPSNFGMPGMFHPYPTDENYRRFFEHYALVMESGSWDEILRRESAKVGVPA
ncbi:MAG TPA: Rieske 2Fe-2S domain-containing protein [Dehalococcoidia bacterium]|nr:Rieske 2Fe-2S domain-containing protein [Dehalococcoidia bacterium]